MGVQAREYHNDTNQKERRKKIMAILAAGSVVGIGAMITLASWNDSEFLNADYSSGEFDIEGSANGTTFTSIDTSPGRALTFTVDPDKLTPGATVYSPYSIQLSSGSNYEADLKISNSATGDLAGALSYSVYEVPTFAATCSAATPPTTALVTNRAVSATGTIDLGVDLLAAGTPEHLCFVITVDPNEANVDQNESSNVIWEISAESGNAI